MGGIEGSSHSASYLYVYAGHFKNISIYYFKPQT